MKDFRKYIKYGLAAVLMTGCDTRELHDLNINPQALNQVDLNFIFTSAELAIASNGSSGDNRYIDWRTNIGWCAYAMGAKGEKVEVDPETFKIVDGKLYLFYNKFFNNTLESWNKDEARLRSNADKNWSKIIQQSR